MQIEVRGDVHVLHLADEDTLVNPGFLARMNGVLDDLDTVEGPAALVTAGAGKIWQNGLDLEHLAANPSDIQDTVTGLQLLLARLATIGMPTVAAITGHAFAAGAMLSLAHDLRVMREDRGWWCLPEVDINIPFTTGMDAFIKSRVPKTAQMRAMVFGHRFPADEAVAAGIVDATAPEEEVIDIAVSLAESLAGKAGQGMRTIKERLHGSALDSLREPEDFSLPGAS